MDRSAAASKNALGGGANGARVVDLLGAELPASAPSATLGLDDSLASPATAAVTSQQQQPDEEDAALILDPNHELMRRVQDTLRKQLLAAQTRLDEELREKNEALRQLRRDREDTGVQLYTLQQQLARQQLALERSNDVHAQLVAARREAEEKLAAMRQTVTHVDRERSQRDALLRQQQADLDRLAEALRQVDQFGDDLRAQIAVTKRAVQKASEDKAGLELDKKKQDYLVDDLVARHRRLTDQRTLLQSQLDVQRKDRAAAAEALREASAEMETLVLEKRQLSQQWKSSLVGLGRRNDAHGALSTSLTEQNDKNESLEAELRSLGTAVRREEEQRKALEAQLARAEGEIKSLDQQFSESSEHHESLKQQFALLSRTLQDTEGELRKATAERSALERDIEEQRKASLRLVNDRLKLEEDVAEKLQEQMTSEKIQSTARRRAKKLKETIREMETEMARMQNDVSTYTIDKANTQSSIQQLRAELATVMEEFQEKQSLIARQEGESRRRTDLVSRKQNQIDKVNRKIEQLTQDVAKEEEVGPLETVIAGLKREIAAKREQIDELKQFWLRQQNELVFLSKENADKEEEVETLRKQHVILDQKLSRVDHDIEAHRSEAGEYRRNLKHLQLDVGRLQALINRNSDKQSVLAEENLVLEMDIVGRLREAELQSIRLEQQLLELQEERNGLLNALVEAERQMMLWEKKIQLARETQAALDPDVGGAEIRSMQSEIHRMELRLTSLKREQEQLIVEMERSITKREQIGTRAAMQTKTNTLTQATLKRRVEELDKKIKQAARDTAACDREARSLLAAQDAIHAQLESAQQTNRAAREKDDANRAEIERLRLQRMVAQEQLVFYERLAKRYAACLQGKYVATRPVDQVVADIDRFGQLVHSVGVVVQQVAEEQPEVQGELSTVARTIQRATELSDRGTLAAAMTSADAALG
jgi:coiled-coil domain-containing protein 40